MSKKLTNEQIDQKLITTNKPFIRISNYINAITHITWKCNNCNNTWLATSNSIFSANSGCPYCYGNMKYTNNDIDNMIINRLFIRISDYNGMNNNILWQCKTCNNKWYATPRNIIHDNNNCPKCANTIKGTKKSAKYKDIAIAALSNKNMTLLSPYTKITAQYNIKCNLCRHEWEETLHGLIYDNYGCPNCTSVSQLTNKIIDTRLELNNRNIIRIGDYIDALTPIEWQCENGHTWNVIADPVINANTGCPYCSKGLYNLGYIKRGYNLSHMTTLYLIHFTNFTESFIKIGITIHNVKKRFQGKLYKQYNINILTEYKLILEQCINIEQHIKYTFREYQYTPLTSFAGRTECFIFTKSLVEHIKQTIENQINILFKI